MLCLQLRFIECSCLFASKHNNREGARANEKPDNNKNNNNNRFYMLPSFAQ